MGLYLAIQPTRQSGLFIFTMIEEIWKDVLWYEGLYRVNNAGIILNKRLHQLRPSYTKDGYLQQLLSKNWVIRNHLVHRLVAISFFWNHIWKEVNHINWIKTDNRIENLEWVTHKENIIHSHKYLDRKSRKWIKIANYKYNWFTWWEHHSSKVVLQYSDNFELIKKWDSLTIASKTLWIWIYWISKSCNKKIIKSWWFIWRYE